MPLSRRDFLKKVGLVTGAAVAAPVLSSLPDLVTPEPEEVPPLVVHRYEPEPDYRQLQQLNDAGILSNQTTTEMLFREYFETPFVESDEVFFFDHFTPSFLIYETERVELLDSSSG